MSAESPDPVIVEYIRANRGTYTREAIERELAVAGHAPEAVAAAWAAIEAADAPAAPPDVARRSSLRSPRFWLTWLLATLASSAPAAILAFATGNSDLAGVGGLIWFGGLVVFAVAGLVLVFIRRLQLYGLGLLMAAATLVLIPFIAIFVVIGYCFVLLFSNP